MTQTIGKAVAQLGNGAQAQIKAYRADFATVLPSHMRADTWVRLAQGLLRRDAKLRVVAERNVGSFLAALLDCARLGLEPGVTYHFVPFGNEIVGIQDYKGVVELIYRAGAVRSVKCEVVYQFDVYDYQPDVMERPKHTPPEDSHGHPNWFLPVEARGPMVGAYAYAEMKDGGTSRVVQMARWEIDQHKAVSKTAHLPDSLWNKWPRAAWLKTVTKELAKWVPTSPEWITHKIRAERAGEEPGRELSPGALALPPPVRDDEVVDGEVIAPEPTPAPGPPPAVEQQQRPPEADAAAQKPSKSQMNRLFKLLGEGGVTSDDARHRLAAHVLERDEVATFTDLTANDVSHLITRLEQLKAQGRLGVQQAEPGAPSGNEREPRTGDEGDQP